MINHHPALLWASLKKRAWRQTESKALRKSTKIAKTVFLSFLYLDEIVCIVRTWSYVCAFLVKPSWLSESGHDVCPLSKFYKSVK